MKTADWKAVETPKVLLVGESSMLQWSEEVPRYAMFLDYYFSPAPYDLGERSRWSDARTLLELIEDTTDGECKAENVYGTLLTNEEIARSPKGKRRLIPDSYAAEGVEHIMDLLKRFPSIKYVFVIGLQTNYHLQRLGFYNCGELTESFVKGAEPRRLGATNYKPYYQPVNAKPFREVCFRRFDAVDFEGVEVIPMLPVNSYPLCDSELLHFGDALTELMDSFKHSSK